MRESRFSRVPWFALAVLLVIADQWSKSIASRELLYAVPKTVFPWFNLTLHHNQGAAFSFLSDAGGWQRWFFAALAGAVSAMLCVWLWSVREMPWYLRLALALVLGGAVGNLLDRLRLGYVVDFISVHYAGWYFPTFNLADSAISVGATLLVVQSIFGRNEHSTGEAA